MHSWLFRRAPLGVLFGFSLLFPALGCHQASELPQRNHDLSVAEEVYRMFCMRVAAAAYPADPSGDRFVPACEGSAAYDAEDGDNVGQKRLQALVERRDETVSALAQVLGEVEGPSTEAFAEKELEDFLVEMLPYYGSEKGSLIPLSTRALDAMMTRLKDPDDALASGVRSTLARISSRVGYRSPDRTLAVVRPMLAYPKIDEVSRELLGFVSEGGGGHDAFLQLLEAVALELAEPAEEQGDGPTTLSVALKLLLEPHPSYAEAGKAPLWILARDDEGNALARGDGGDATPFAVPGLDDAADRDDDARALGPDGQPLYETFDANQTALASLLRDGIPLARRDGEARSTIEKLLRALKPMLGGEKQRSEQFGRATLTFDGFDVENSPVAELLHAVVQLAKFPETRDLIEVLEKLIASDESSAMEIVNTALAINDEAKKSKYDSAKIIGIAGEGTPSEFWDDLIGMGQRVIAREGLLRDVLAATEGPVSPAQGKVLANLMRFRDDVKFAEDINAAIDHTWADPVDRTMPDVGMNRSVWQRGLSLIDATLGAPNCNKQGATLSVTEPLPLTFPDPASRDPVVGAVVNLACPPNAGGGNSYARCAFNEQKSGAVTQMRSIIGKTELFLKDKQLICAAESFGVNLSEAQEKSSGIKGFTLKPTAAAIGRFIYAPRNKFLSDLFDPYQTRHGVPVTEFEPNLLAGLEARDPNVTLEGEPQSFLTTSIPLIEAFDKYETFDANGDPTNGYLFAELLQTLHRHWPAPRDVDCSATPVVPGCSSRKDPMSSYYAPQSNLVSYEPLLIYALGDQDLLGVLQRAQLALRKVKLGERDGVQVLERFLDRMLRPDPKLAYRDGRNWSKTNTCEVMEQGGARKCKDDRGRIIEGVAPLYLMLDALRAVDDAWNGDDERHGLWLEARSKLVDQLLTVEKQGAGFRLKNRRAHALTLRALPWLKERIDEHKAAGDLEAWVDGSDTEPGLADRALEVLAHPILARAVDLYDAFWQDQAAGDQVAAVTEYLMDEQNNEAAFTDLIVLAADTLELVDRDPDLTPALRFAALAIAPNALDTVSSGGTLDVEDGAANRFLQVTYELAKIYEQSPRSPLARLLKNAVEVMSAPEPSGLAGKTPLVSLIDVIAEVNRATPEAPRTTPLTAEDNRQVFEQLSQFLSSEDRGLERLYRVIENRKLTD